MIAQPADAAVTPESLLEEDRALPVRVRVTAGDIESMQFTSRRFRIGYDEDEVDDFLDAVEDQVAADQRLHDPAARVLGYLDGLRDLGHLDIHGITLARELRRALDEAAART